MVLQLPEAIWWQNWALFSGSVKNIQRWGGTPLLPSSGVARGGAGGATAPSGRNSAPPLAPPKWNYTLYRGLWRAAILSPGQPPLLTPQPPLPPPHFEKSGYAPAPIERGTISYSFKPVGRFDSHRPKPNIVTCTVDKSTVHNVITMSHCIISLVFLQNAY